MGRIANALFNGVVSGAFQGLEDHFVSNQDSRVTKVSNNCLPTQSVNSSSCERVPLQGPDGRDRVPVGRRGAGWDVVRNKSSDSMEPSNARSIPTTEAKENLVAQSSSGLGSSRASVNRDDSKPRELDNRGGIFLQRDPQGHGVLKDDLVMDRLHTSKAIIEDPITSTMIVNSERSLQPLPSVDFMKNGIKNAWMAARKEAGLDGSSAKKVPLCEIMNSASSILLRKYGVCHPDDVVVRYAQAANLAQKNVEAFIQNVAPHVDARLVAEVMALEAGRAVNSHVCLSKAAEAALQSIDKQSQGIQPILSQNGHIVYSSAGLGLFSRPNSEIDSSRGHDSEEANPYSPLGAPNAQHLNVDRFGGEGGSSFVAKNDLVNQENSNPLGGDFSQFLKDVDSRVYFEVGSDGPRIGVSGSAGALADKGDALVHAISEKVVEMIDNHSPVVFSDNPDRDYSGPIYPSFP